jgi:hypothetical protein
MQQAMASGQLMPQMAMQAAAVQGRVPQTEVQQKLPPQQQHKELKEDQRLLQHRGMSSSSPRSL